MKTMKKFAKAKKITIEQAGIKLHKLEIDLDVEEVGLGINMVLNKDTNAPMDYFNEELINQSDAIIKKTPIVYEDDDGAMKSFNKYSLATFIADVVFSTFDSLSSKGIEGFKVYITEAKEVLKKYEKENGPIIDKVKDIPKDVDINNTDKGLDMVEEIHGIVSQILDEVKKPREVFVDRTVKKKKKSVDNVVNVEPDYEITEEYNDDEEVNQGFSFGDIQFKTKKIKPGQKI